MCVCVGGRGGGKNKNKIFWVSWDVICNDRGNWGLGIRDLYRLKLTLLGKWIWRFLNEPNCLWASVVKSRYGGFTFSVR